MKNQTFPQPICEQIWNGKYRLTTPNEAIADDMSVEDTWRRIAKACAVATPEIYGDAKGVPDLAIYQNQWEQHFYEALENFSFLPAGRITAGAGSGRNVTLFNCYVMGTIPDDMAGIFEMLKEAALTMQQGGGIGYDFSTIRPKGAPVKGVDADASGPITFMDCWDAMCRTIMSAGSRRGAMMATMRCDHPDVMDFITAKREAARLRMFNVSVLATDAFMEAVKFDRPWELVHEKQPADTSLGKNADGKWIYEVISAKQLWETMMESTYNYAEPGVLFVDRINQMNNLHYCETISATNPCGEQPLPPYGACLLGSLNLATFVKNPFSNESHVDFERLKKVTRTAVRMLDAVIDVSLFPLEAQREEAKAKRRMGLGVTGLADMLLMLNMTYGSKDAADTAEVVMRMITIAAYEESIALARQFGPCPVTETKEQRMAFVQSGFMQRMPSYLRDEIIQAGIRNALLTSIAPTGTISLYAGNVSSGVEPIFATGYTRKVLEKDGSKREEKVFDAALLEWKFYAENNGLDMDAQPPALVTAQDLSPMAHIVMQAAVQRWIDSSISKTVNCPVDISFEDFKDVYWEAYETGCKGCTTYRPNEVTGSVLSVDEPAKPAEPVAEETHEVIPFPGETISRAIEPLARPVELMGHTYKLKWNNDNLYVTINDAVDEVGTIVPFEIFINSKNVEHFAWTVALTRMVSAIFRRGGNVDFVAEELKNVFDPSGGAWVGGKYVPSLIALIGQTVQTHLKRNRTTTDAIVTEPEVLLEQQITEKPIQCGECKGFNVKLQSGCPVCGDCGHSKCG
jgi:ribonucleoside-diphosphate reductase alpha chain